MKLFYCLLFSILLITIADFVCAQESSDTNTEVTQSVHDYYESKLQGKGVFILSQNNYLRFANDYEKVLNINFDKYRLIDKTIRIDLVNGFELRLYSFDQMMDNGLTFNQSIYDEKMSSFDPDVRSIDVVKLNVQLGKKDLSGQEAWKVK